MDKTSQKVTKDRKRAEAARKGRENYMNKLKESILNDIKKVSGESSNETTSATNTATFPATTPANSTTKTATSDTYVYVTGILAVLAIGVCVFLTYSKKAGQIIHEKPIKPKRRNMV